MGAASSDCNALVAQCTKSMDAEEDEVFRGAAEARLFNETDYTALAAAGGAASSGVPQGGGPRGTSASDSGMVQQAALAGAHGGGARAFSPDEGFDDVASSEGPVASETDREREKREKKERKEKKRRKKEQEEQEAQQRREAEAVNPLFNNLNFDEAALVDPKGYERDQVVMTVEAFSQGAAQISTESEHVRGFLTYFCFTGAEQLDTVLLQKANFDEASGEVGVPVQRLVDLICESVVDDGGVVEAFHNADRAHSGFLSLEQAREVIVKLLLCRAYAADENKQLVANVVSTLTAGQEVLPFDAFSDVCVLCHRAFRGVAINRWLQGG